MLPISEQAIWADCPRFAQSGSPRAGEPRPHVRVPPESLPPIHTSRQELVVPGTSLNPEVALVTPTPNNTVLPQWNARTYEASDA